MTSRNARYLALAVGVFATLAMTVESRAQHSEARGTVPTISLVEVDPPEGVVIDLQQDRRWFEIRLSGWAPAALGAWQAKIDPNAFVPTADGAIALAQEPCCSDELCESLFGTGATCNMAQGFCTPAFQDATRFNWLFDAPSGPMTPPYLTFTGTTADVPAPSDDGTQRYGGTIVVDPTYVLSTPVTLPIDFLPMPDSFMLDELGAQLPQFMTSSGEVARVFGRCCIIFDGSCRDFITFADCTLLGGFWGVNDTCSNGCLECIRDTDCADRDPCTSETCFKGLSCDRTLIYDLRTECCDPLTAEFFGDDTAKLDPCMRIVCDRQALTFSFEPLPVGSACDDGDICTRRTFCNAAGKCVGRPNPGAGCPKNRYASFAMDQLLAAGCGDQRAVRVTFINIDGFGSFNGETRWLSAPVVYPKAGTQADGIIASELQCTPHFDNFGGAGLMHIFGAGIVPNSTYEVQSVDQTCLDLNDPTCYSPPLTIQTGTWGDVVKPFAATATGQPTFIDIAALVASFLASPNAPSKVRAQLQPDIPVPTDAISFKDITEGVGAFLSIPYPFSGPATCP